MIDDAITLEVVGEQLHVTGCKAHFELLAMKAHEFPPFPVADEKAPFVVKATDLRRMVGQTIIASAKENGTHARAGILFRLGGGQLTLVATDARRLAKATCNVESADEAEALLPSSTAKMVIPMLADAGKDDVVDVSLGDRRAA